jgi:hypothetical protein
MDFIFFNFLFFKRGEFSHKRALNASGTLGLERTRGHAGYIGWLAGSALFAERKKKRLDR